MLVVAGDECGHGLDSGPASTRQQLPPAAQQNCRQSQVDANRNTVLRSWEPQVIQDRLPMQRGTYSSSPAPAGAQVRERDEPEVVGDRSRVSPGRPPGPGMSGLHD
jgi:hypothetical protein